MNTRIIATLATAAALVSAANINAQEFEFEANYGVESEYVFRGVEITSESFQGSISATYGDAYAGVWMSEAIDDFGSDTSEFDFFAGYGFALDDTLSLDVGGTLYHYPDASGDDTFEAYVGLAADIALAPALYAYYDFDLKALTLEGSIGHSIEIDEKSGVDLGLSLGYVDGEGGFSYIYYGATADYVYSLSENTSVSAGVRYSANDEDLGASPDGNFWGGLSITTAF